jgi:hypothetical protein
MRTLMWTLAWIGVAIWSLIAWSGHAIIGIVGAVFGGGGTTMDFGPIGGTGLQNLVDAMADLGQGAVLVVWALVSLMILAVPAILGRIFGSRRRAKVGMSPGMPYANRGDIPRGEPMRRQSLTSLARSISEQIRHR